MWRGRPFDFAQGRLSPAKGADFYSGAVRSRDPQTIVIPIQLYRLRFRLYKEEYGKKIDITFRFGNRVVYPPTRSMLFIDLAFKSEVKSLSLRHLHVKS